jgi:hypothetical protein
MKKNFTFFSLLALTTVAIAQTKTIVNLLSTDNRIQSGESTV